MDLRLRIKSPFVFQFTMMMDRSIIFLKSKTFRLLDGFYPNRLINSSIEPLQINLTFSRILWSGQFHHLISSSFQIVSSSKRYRITRAGFPATTAYGGTSLITTE